MDGAESVAGVAAGVAGTVAGLAYIAAGMASIAASVAGNATDVAGIAASVALRPPVIEAPYLSRPPRLPRLPRQTRPRAHQNVGAWQVALMSAAGVFLRSGGSAC